MIRTLLRLLQPRHAAAQRGAMFGMDARIALIVAAILAAAGGVTYMSKLERDKVSQAEDGANVLRQGLSKYYQNVSINVLPDNLEPLFASGTVAEPSLRKDPWGNPWYYSRASMNVELEGTPITVHYAVIFSAGKDGVADTSPLTSEADYAGWQTAKDDIGVKFSTRDIEVARRAEYVARAQLIIDKLEATESAAYIEAQAGCTAEGEQPTWCTDHEGKNYTQFNYYPPSSMDEVEDSVSYGRNVLSKPAYQSGEENDMQQLMLDIGLPAAYAKDPWGRILNYHSNVTNRTDPPFAASICYSFGDNCFARVQQ